MSESASEAAASQRVVRDYGVYRDPTALTNGVKAMLAVSAPAIAAGIPLDVVALVMISKIAAHQTAQSRLADVF
jgi:hypothetical protein